MTFGEIYKRVMWMLYGDSSYPASTEEHMKNTSQGIIIDAHSKVQEDYNYWFMEATKVYKRSANQTVLELPEDLLGVKAVRAYRIYNLIGTYQGAYVNEDGNLYNIEITGDYGYNQLCVKISDKWYLVVSIDDGNILTVGNDEASGTVELYEIRFSHIIQRKQNARPLGYDIFDECYETTDDRLMIYGASKYDNLIELIYYKKYSLSGGFETYSDPVTENAYNIIIYYAVEMEERRRREFQAAEYYRKLALDETVKLQRKHLKMKNTNLINYVGG